MPAENPDPRKRRFKQKSLRILKHAKGDAGYQWLRARTDLRMLLVFLESFDQLGWWPPLDLEKRRLLTAHDVIMHMVRDDLCFYEFCSKGARGERNPWLSLFFHVDEASAVVRILGVEQTELVERRRTLVLERIRVRVQMLDRWLRGRTRS